MRWVALALPFLLLSATAGCRGRDPLIPAPGFTTAAIGIGDGARTVELEVEVAADPPARQLGLMYRQELQDGRGMLFTYPRPTAGGHWMANTYIPLDIAYADGEGVIFKIVQGRPLDRTVLDAGAPFVFVLEVPQGWFARNRLAAGAQLSLPDGLPARE